MLAIKAHFDGRVSVPDEPVPLRLGELVVVQPAAGSRKRDQATAAIRTFLLAQT